MKRLQQTIKVLTLAVALSTSLSACPAGPPLMPGQGMQQSDFGNLNGQQAVPDEFLVKRKGHAYLEDPMVFAQQHGLLFVREIEALGVELFKATNPAAIEQIRPLVDYVEPNYLRYLSLPPQTSMQSLSMFHRQNAEAGATLPATNNYIGLVDTGVDTSHPDLQGKLIPGHNTLGQNDVHDANGHGTYLAGVAVGQNPAQELNGVLPGGKILPIKALDSNGIGTDFSIAEGIILAIEYGAQVIVLSATGHNQSQALTAAIDYANKQNIPIVTPAGNQMDAASVFPGNSRGVIAVNSVDVTGQNMTRFSRPGQNVTISATGEGIRSTLPMHSFSLSRMGLSSGHGQLQTPGTAAMQVAAAIAAIKGMSPGIRLPEIRNQLMASADDLGQPGMDPQFGSGRLNIGKLSAVARVGAQAYPQQQPFPQQPQMQAYGYGTAPQQQPMYYYPAQQQQVAAYNNPYAPRRGY